MKVKFLRSHRGRETQERYYQSGETAVVEDDMGLLLIQNGWAKEVEEPERPLPAPEPVHKVIVTKKGRRK